MPWRKLHTLLDCAVCGQPTTTGHTTERINLSSRHLIDVWMEPRCKEHAYKLHVKGSCNHGGRMEGEHPVIVPTCKVEESRPISLKERITFRNLTRKHAIDDRENRRH